MRHRRSYITMALATIIVSYGTSWGVMLFTGSAHSADHRIPAPGWSVVNPLVSALMVIAVGLTILIATFLED